jgi:hypothetical protein
MNRVARAKRDLSRLAKKQIVDKRGRKTTVYVRPEGLSKADLLSMYDRDQAVRNNPDSTWADYKAIDTENLSKMKAHTDKHGWNFQGDNEFKAWVIVQHGDHDPGYQSWVLSKMKEKSSRKDLMAFLEDRVSVNTGKPQKYGTQVVQKKGKYVPNKLADKANVDKYRKEAGLEPLSEYLKGF